MGDVAGGFAQLDTVMVAVTGTRSGRSPRASCTRAVILECMQLFDLKRAAEWTDALGVWCDAQPDLVPYRGQCLVHQSQLQQAAGDWPDAITTAEAACRRLTDPPHPALGLAHYQEGELHRLVGAFEQAELDYRRASRHGYDPLPGLALLQLARGDGATAAAAIQRARLRSPRSEGATGTAGRRGRHPLRRGRPVRGPIGRRRAGDDRRRSRRRRVLGAMAAHANRVRAHRARATPPRRCPSCGPRRRRGRPCASRTKRPGPAIQVGWRASRSATAPLRSSSSTTPEPSFSELARCPT